MIDDLAGALGIDADDPDVRRAEMLAEADHRLLGSLVRLRKDRGVTQVALAERLGISQASVASFEKYDNDPKLSTVRRYANALEAMVLHRVQPDWEATGEPDPPMVDESKLLAQLDDAIADAEPDLLEHLEFELRRRVRFCVSQQQRRRQKHAADDQPRKSSLTVLSFAGSDLEFAIPPRPTRAQPTAPSPPPQRRRPRCTEPARPSRAMSEPSNKDRIAQFRSAAKRARHLEATWDLTSQYLTYLRVDDDADSEWPLHTPVVLKYTASSVLRHDDQSAALRHQLKVLSTKRRRIQKTPTGWSSRSSWRSLRAARLGPSRTPSVGTAPACRSFLKTILPVSLFAHVGGTAAGREQSLSTWSGRFCVNSAALGLLHPRSRRPKHSDERWLRSSIVFYPT